MNEFYMKMNYEYLLGQMGEIGLETIGGSGTHKKEKRHLFLGEQGFGMEEAKRTIFEY